MPSKREILRYSPGETYSESVSELPNGLELGSEITMVEGGRIIRLEIASIGSETATIQVLENFYGTSCRKLGYNQGWGNNLCQATDRPCHQPEALEELCNSYYAAKREKEVLRDGKKAKRTGINEPIDSLDYAL